MSEEKNVLGDKFAEYLNIKTIFAKDGYAKVSLDVRPYFLNGESVVHGGVVFTLADFAFALASNSGKDTALAVNCDIQFIKAGKIGDELFAEAELISRSRRLGTYRIIVTNKTGDILASVQSMSYYKPKS